MTASTEPLDNPWGDKNVYAPSTLLMALVLVGCGGGTKGATCGPGTMLVGGQCLVPSDDGAAGTMNVTPAQTDAASVQGQDAEVISDAGEPFVATPILWTGNFVGTPPNKFGIRGWIWADNDCKTAADSGLPCDMPDPSLVGADHKPGWSVTPDAFCMKGTAEPITDWNVQWGADMGFNFNPDGTSPFDGSKLRGFMFDFTGTAPDHVDVVLKVATVKQGYTRSVKVPSTDSAVLFAGPDGVAQPMTTPTAELVPFDPSQMVFVLFIPTAQLGVATPYDFCVRNVRGLE